MLTLLVKASLLLVVLLAFYKIFLEKESFFAVNRAYLLATLLVIFTFPFLTLPQLVKHQGYVAAWIENSEQLVANTTLPESTKAKESVETSQTAIDKILLPAASNNELASEAMPPKAAPADNGIASPIPPAAPSERGLSFWLLLIYLFGIGVLFLNLMTQVSSILQKAWANKDKIVDSDGIIVNMDAVVEPCSFFRYIFINPESYDYATYEQIIAHEKIHVNKWHSLDLLLTELAVIVLWFNPFIWIFRKEVEKNIEYQTDDLLLHNKVGKKEDYQMSLLKIATYNKPLTVTTNYNQSLIKQRILKMNAKKSNAHSYWKYAFVAPLLFVMALLLNKPSQVFAHSENTPIDLEDKNENTLFNNEATKNNKQLTNRQSTESTTPEDYNEAPAQPNSDNQEIAPPIFSENQSIVKDTSKCHELEEAALAGDIEKVIELLKTLDPDCLLNGDQLSIENLDKLKSIMNDEDVQVSIEMAEQVEDLDTDALIARLNNGEFKSSTNSNPECKALIDAVRAQDISKVKEMLKTVDPNCIDPDPEYEKLVVNGNNWYNRKSQTALVAATKKGDLEIAKLLVGAGAKVKFHTESDPSPLMAAAEYGHDKLVKYLMKEGADAKEITQGYGTALHCAARNGHLEIVKYLLAEGSDINAQNQGQGTALNGAARHGHLETVKYLLSQGADINKQNQGQGSALNAAARHGHNETISYLLSQGVDINAQTQGQGSALNAAARHGHLETVKLLLDNGADINVENQGQGSALNAAARHGHLDIIKLLLEKGVDINAQTQGQGSALNAAARHGNLDIVKYLLAQGADIETANAGQGSALNAAARHGNIDIVKYLLSQGADINAHTPGQGTALNAAVRHEETEIVKYLIAQGADVNLAEPGHGTALMRATKNNNIAMAKILLENGADPNASPSYQESPMEYVRKKEMTKLLDLFKKYSK